MELRKFIATTIREYLNENVENNKMLEVNDNNNVVINGVEFISDKNYGTVRRDNSQNVLQGIVYVNLYNTLKTSIINGLNKNETLSKLSKVTRSSEMVIKNFLNYIGLDWEYDKITENKSIRTNLWI